MERNADGTVVTVERVIHAPASAIFAVVADAARHPEIDGSGTVIKAKPGAPDHLELGSVFGMSMKMGVPYAMVSTVIEYEPNRRLAWQTRGPTPIGRYVAGRIWRYELEPTETGTLVRETWDISQESLLTKPMAKTAGPATAHNMAATLDRIAAIVER